MTRPTKILAADLFCGAGGFTTGLMRELESMGIDCELVAINHNPVAIATHERNHPRARHEILDLNTADPEALVPEGRLHILLASPTCTFHSRARGGKPTSDQERMDPWVIVTWCTKLRVKRLIIENVPEFVDWGPIDPRTGKAIRSRKGEYFAAWLVALEAIGYKIDWRIITCADNGDATTRRRFFLKARNDRRAVQWPEPTHTREGVEDLFGKKQRWRPAREIINWKDRGRSIFGRRLSLKPNSLRRIRSGSVKLTGPWAEVFKAVVDQELYRSILQHEACVGTPPPKRRGKKGGKVKKPKRPVFNYRGPQYSEDLPVLRFVTRNGRIVREDSIGSLPSIDGAVESFLVHYRGTGTARATSLPIPGVTAQGNHLGLVQPFVFQVNQSHGRYRSFRSVDLPLFAVLTRDSYGLAAFDIAPFTCANRTNNAARGTEQPIAPIVTSGGIFLARPSVFLLAQGSNGAPQRADTDPVPTVTTVSRIQLIEPCVSPFILGQHAGSAPRGTDDPLMTICRGGAHALVQPLTMPFLLNRHGDNGSHVRGRSIDSPIFAATCSGGGYLVEPYLLVLKKQSDTASIDAPTPAITTRRHLAVVEPFIVLVNHGMGGGVDRSRPVSEPLSAVTTHHGFAIVDPFLTPYYGGAQAPNGWFAHSVSLPVPAITTHARFGLVMPQLDAFLIPNFGERTTQEPRFHLLDYPLPAVTSHGAGGLAQPFIVSTSHSGSHGLGIRACSLPLPTLTTARGGEFALAQPFIICTRHARQDSGPRPRSVEEPLATITANAICCDFAVVSPMPEHSSGRVVYVDGVAILVDILFRMLRNPELAAAMSFTDEEYTYEFTGTATQITKQIGNAVPVRTARALIRSELLDLIPARKAPPRPEALVA